MNQYNNNAPSPFIPIREQSELNSPYGLRMNGAGGGGEKMMLSKPTLGQTIKYGSANMLLKNELLVK
jgi:hypothetical protein